MIKNAKALVEEVFNLIYYGKLSYTDIFFMPSHVRRYYAKLLSDTKKQEKTDIDNIGND